MRFPDQSLIGDLGDGVTSKTSASISILATSSLDENQTTYDLLPTIINRPPVIVEPIELASTPQIKPYETADASGKYLYYFPDGTVKINLGAKITLAVKAEQPQILNVENGILTMVKPSVGLTYIWRKNGIMLNSDQSFSLQSKVTVSGNSVSFDNIQPSDAGTYTCDISNDIGTVTTEPVIIEVLNLDFDALFYRNLINNPYGANGTDGWQVNNDDLTTKRFTKIPSTDLIKPDRPDLFGYTMDTLHPRPYQLDTGVIQGFDMTKEFLKDNASYFTRTRYKFLKRGGSFLVRAYQDIDLSDIVWLTKGGVFGVEGVRAIFSCYIGNALTTFMPVQELVDPKNRRLPQNYVLNKPRISKENFLLAGPSHGVQEHVYVSFEEYDNETRLASHILQKDGSVVKQENRITLADPWTSRLWKYWGQKYYDKDIYGLGELSSGDGRDAVLFVADELYPDESVRYAYGQYAEFNKVVLDRLNPNTTKVRVTLNFQTSDWRIFEQWKEGFENSEEVFEFVSWESPYERNRWTKPQLDWGKTITSQITKLPGNEEKGVKALPTSPDPRGFASAINVTLLPVLTQQKSSTEYYTNISLVKNDTPESVVQTGLIKSRPYDPYGLASKKLLFTFDTISDGKPVVNNLGVIETKDRLKIGLKIRQKDSQTNTEVDKNLGIDPIRILPIQPNSAVTVESLPDFAQKDSALNITFNDYVRYRFVDSYESSREKGVIVSGVPSANYETIALEMKDAGFTVSNITDRVPEQGNDVPTLWSNKIRLQLFFGLKGSQITQTKLSPSKIDKADQGRVVRLQSYYLDIDFSGAESKVTLSRPSDQNMYPGFGSGTYELEHSIDPYGNLICDIPSQMKFSMAPGLGFSRLKGEAIVINDTPINCLKALHANVGQYVRGSYKTNGYFNNLADDILQVVKEDVANTSFAEAKTIKQEYLTALTNYVNNVNSLPTAKYNTIDKTYNTSLTIDLEDEAFTGLLPTVDKPAHLSNLKKPDALLELLAVYNPSTTQNGIVIGTPSYFEDENGISYTIGYAALPQ